MFSMPHTKHVYVQYAAHQARIRSMNVLPPHCRYDTSRTMWMFRGYNGSLYAQSRRLSKKICKFHKGDFVR